MSYTPTEWKSGDIVTAEKLNKLEGALADTRDVFVVTFSDLQQNPETETSYIVTADKTIPELKEAYENGSFIVGVVNMSNQDMTGAISIGSPQVTFFPVSNEYSICTFDFTTYSISTANNYVLSGFNLHYTGADTSVDKRATLDTILIQLNSSNS